MCCFFLMHIWQCKTIFSLKNDDSSFQVFFVCMDFGLGQLVNYVMNRMQLNFMRQQFIDYMYMHPPFLQDCSTCNNTCQNETSQFLFKQIQLNRLFDFPPKGSREPYFCTPLQKYMLRETHTLPLYAKCSQQMKVIIIFPL